MVFTNTPSKPRPLRRGTGRAAKRTASRVRFSSRGDGSIQDFQDPDNNPPVSYDDAEEDLTSTERSDWEDLQRPGNQYDVSDGWLEEDDAVRIPNRPIQKVVRGSGLISGGMLRSGKRYGLEEKKHKAKAEAEDDDEVQAERENREDEEKRESRVRNQLQSVLKAETAPRRSSTPHLTLPTFDPPSYISPHGSVFTSTPRRRPTISALSSGSATRPRTPVTLRHNNSPIPPLESFSSPTPTVIADYNDPLFNEEYGPFDKPGGELEAQVQSNIEGLLREREELRAERKQRQQESTYKDPYDVYDPANLFEEPSSGYVDAPTVSRKSKKRKSKKATEKPYERPRFVASRDRIRYKRDFDGQPRAPPDRWSTSSTEFRAGMSDQDKQYVDALDRAKQQVFDRAENSLRAAEMEDIERDQREQDAAATLAALREQERQEAASTLL